MLGQLTHASFNNCNLAFATSSTDFGFSPVDRDLGIAT